MGNVSVLKIEKEPYHIVPTNHTIPFSISHGEIHTHTHPCPIYMLLIKIFG